MLIWRGARPIPNQFFNRRQVDVYRPDGRLIRRCWLIDPDNPIRYEPVPPRAILRGDGYLIITDIEGHILRITVNRDDYAVYITYERFFSILTLFAGDPLHSAKDLIPKLYPDDPADNRAEFILKNKKPLTGHNVLTDEWATLLPDRETGVLQWRFEGWAFRKLRLEMESANPPQRIGGYPP